MEVEEMIPLLGWITFPLYSKEGRVKGSSEATVYSLLLGGSYYGMDGPRLVVESKDLREPPDISDVLASDHQGLSPWTGLHQMSLLEASLAVKAPSSRADERA